MAGKVNLDIQTILDKEFEIDFKGYSSDDVDSFLDLVMEDYQTYQEITAELNQKIAELERTNASLRAKLIEEEGKTRAMEQAQAQAAATPAAQGAANVDILKRLSRLEEMIFELNQNKK
ncbi:MAG: DivIVA domain-containing protein [Solobacterium sp.]|jgi:DivIVA domain-containing protein|nr:DivIVA domain-containing protein [Solobacterium sp.]